MIFNFRNIATVNCFQLEDGIWFSANDIASALGYTDKDQAVRKHTFESDRKRLNFKASVVSTEPNLRSLWGRNDFSDKTLINESGLYCMVFGSKLPAAEEFKLWVTGTVLPSIRKNGGYIMNQELLSKEQEADLNAAIQQLSKKVAEVTALNDKFKTRWHELIAEKAALKEQMRALKEDNKKLKANVAILKEDANDQQMILEKALKDLDEALNKLNPRPKEAAAGLTVKDKGLAYKIDPSGFIYF